MPTEQILKYLQDVLDAINDMQSLTEIEGD